MVKPRKILFTDTLESVLVNIWGGTRNHLSNSLVKKTRRALIEIRGIYRFRGDFPGKYPSSIKYRLRENRAGYLAAFGQRHAYLTYLQVKRVEGTNTGVIPNPENSKGELVVTTLGAGPAIEMYGLCLALNEDSQRLQKLRLNLIDKEGEWSSSRHTVFEKVLKDTFPKLEIFPTEIDADLTTDCVSKLAGYYDKLAATQILLIYNVLNEIHVRHAAAVWKNINFILKACDRPVLILVMEPSVPKARARVEWLRRQLAQSSDVILDVPEEEFVFDTEPTRIELEGTGDGLNDRLFDQPLDGRRPALQQTVKRTHLACVVRPRSPVPAEQVQRQLASLEAKRGPTGRFKKRPFPQQTFWDSFPEWVKDSLGKE